MDQVEEGTGNKPNTERALKQMWLGVRLLGLDSYKRHTLSYCLYSITLNVIITFYYPFSMVIELFLLQDKMSVVSNLTMTICLVVGSIKAFNTFIKSEDLYRVKDLIVRLDSSVKDQDETDYLNYIVKMAYRFWLAIALLFLVGSTTIEFPVILANERRLIYPAWFPVDWRTSTIIYVFVHAYQAVGIGIFIYMNLLSDSYPGILLWLLKGHVHALGLRISKIGYDASKTNEENYQELVKGIKDYQICSKYYMLCHHLTSKVMSLQFLGSIIILFVAALQILYVSGRFADTLYLMLYFNCMVSEITLLCYSGSALAEESVRFTVALYSCNWMDQDTRFRRALIIFMQRSQEPWIILSGGIVSISLTTWLSDEKNQLLVTNVWLKLEWNDMNLRWNTSEYGGVKDLRIPPHRIWKPDVLMYNSADEGFDGTYPTNVVVRNNGSCLYVPPGIFKSTCKIDITWFPFDDQRCEMKFGSWTYDGFQLDLQLQDEAGGDISSYVLNGEWELLGVPGKRNEIYYNCCPEPYIDITFAIIIRRRTLYYFFNLIVPCVLIASMALLGFTLPPDSGEKLSLGVTILLSLTVFLNMVAETMPATSDAVPLLGTYFNCIMFMVASSVVSTILILNYHHRNASTHEMSEWIRVVFLYWLPCILRMSRPGRTFSLQFPPTPCSDTSSERKHQIISDVELKERSSKSLLANVLDIDDDFRHCRPITPGGTLPHNPAFYRTLYGQGDDGSIGPIGSTRMPDAVTQHTCIRSSTDYELSLILKEIRFITDQLRKEDEDNDIANDWKFAAMVVDRLCLIIFTMFTILATIAVLFSAPHIIVS